MFLGNGSPLVKIDNLAVDGLTGVEDSLAYKVNEIEKHFHNEGKFFGLAAIPAAETHRADRITDIVAPFQADAGNNTFGAWLQVLGSDDTPARAGKVKFDFREILVVDHQHNTNVYAIQVACGESAGLAAKLVAEDFTETMLIVGGGTSETGTIPLRIERQDAGDKVWVRIWAQGQSTSTLDFYIGLHEYDG